MYGCVMEKEFDSFLYQVEEKSLALVQLHLEERKFKMNLKISRRVVLAIGLAIGLTGSIWHTDPRSGSVGADEKEQAALSVNPFHGTYEGGYWGTVPGLGPYGGDVKATVSTAGKVSLTLPGTGAGTVSPTGVYSVTGKLLVRGLTVNVTYTGSLIPTKHPTTGAFLAVIGSGTWKTTTPGVNATGKWLVRRTLSTR